MKKNLFTCAKHVSATATLVVLIVGPFQPLIAQAQGAPLNIQSPAQQAGAQAQTNSSDFIGPTLPAPPTVNTTPTTQQQAAATQQQGGDFPTSGCALASGGSLLKGGDWAQCITDIVYVFTIGIGTGFAYVAAYFFDWAVSLSLNGTAYALDFVSQGWTTARDIANMAFLFILLYIAFKIIFEADTHDTVHMLVLVIVVALLVNFSFFFTRLAIDAGNILSIQFYNAIQVPSVGTTAAGSGVPSSVASGVTQAVGYASAAGTFTGGTTGFSNSKDLTYSIMGMLNLQGLLGNTSFQAWRSSSGYNFLSALITLSFLYIAAGIMLWLLTVAFITNGIKFLFRIVILWFLIIASPLAFVARAVPKFETYYKPWQDALIKHAFYPVAFMFIFLILTNFAKQMGQNNQLINGIFNGLANTGQTSAVASIGYAVANVGIRMGFVIAMLYIGMEAAKKIGVMGADAANHAGNWVGGKVIGTYGSVGRNTAGWAAYKTANAGWARKLEARTGVAGLFGRGLRATTGAVGRASFDARALPGAKSVLKDVGTAQKGGIESAAKATVEAKEKKLKAVEPAEAQKALALEKAKDITPHYREAEEAYKKADAELGEAKAKHRDLIARGAPKSEIDAAKKKVDNVTTTNTATFTRMKILEDMAKEKAKEISGEGLSKKYAATLETRNIRNLGFPLRTSREAAAKVRKGDSNEKKVLDAAKKALKEAEEHHEEPPPAAAPIGPTPAAGGGGGGGGGHH